METLVTLWVILFWGTPVIITIWWLVTRRHRAAVTALGVWFIHTAIILFMAFSCMGGHGCDGPAFTVIPVGVSILAAVAIVWLLARTPNDGPKEA
jgi:hypothetical protein